MMTMKMQWIRRKDGSPVDDYPSPVWDYIAKAVLEANPESDLVAVDAPKDWQPDAGPAVVFDLRPATNEPA